MLPKRWELIYLTMALIVYSEPARQPLILTLSPSKVKVD